MPDEFTANQRLFNERGERLAEYRERVAKLESALKQIQDNAESQLIAQNAIGTPDDSPERISALWHRSIAVESLTR